MANLDEIMAGKGDTAPEPTHDTQQTSPEPVASPQGLDQAQQHQDDADPVDGLRKALDAERGKRKTYTSQLEATQREIAEMRGVISALAQQRQQAPAQPAPAPEPPPDLWTDPAAFVNHQIQQALQASQKTAGQPVDQMRDAMMFNARLAAEARYTPDAVKTAQESFDGAMRTGQLDPRDYQRVMQSPNPFHEAVQWHKRTSALSEIGDDPQAFLERKKAEWLAEMQAGGGAPQPSSGSPQAQAMPTSFAGARSSGPRSTPQWSGPKALSEIMPR